MDFKVILVDDDAVVLFLHKILIKRSILPTPSGVFQDGKQALEYIERSNPQKHLYLILLDINMPVMNGWEFLEAVQEKCFKENVFVAMVTSSINSYDMSTARKYPQVIQYLEKPLRSEAFESLYKQIEDIINEK